TALSRPGRPRRSSQSTRPARIVRRDLIQRIANTELIPAPDLVIELAENIGTVHGVWIDSGRDLRAWIGDRSQLRIDDGRIGRRHRRQARLIEVALFEVREEERTVSHDGP